MITNINVEYITLPPGFAFTHIMTREEALTIIENCEGPELYEVCFPKSFTEMNDLLSAKRKALTKAYKTLC